MKKILPFLLIFLGACVSQNAGLVVFPDGYEVKAELALTPLQQQKGLMYRTELSADRGMLFVFEEHQPRSFWMKNTLIALDIIFISQDNVINCVYDRVPASTVFTADEDVAVVSCPAKYVLEVQAGLSQKHGLKIGDKLDMRYEK